MMHMDNTGTSDVYLYLMSQTNFSIAKCSMAWTKENCDWLKIAMWLETYNQIECYRYYKTV